MLGWSEPRRIGRPGIVTSIVSGAEACVELGRAERRPPLRDRALDLARARVFATAPTFGRSSAGQRADPPQDARQAALLAEDVELERLDRGDVRRGGERRRGLLGEGLEVAGQLGEVHGLLSVLPRGCSMVRAGVPADRARK